MTEATFIPAKDMKRGNFTPCHIENFSFDVACTIFQAQSSRLKATKGAPIAGRHFMLQLTTSRRALITCYDDFHQSLEISLECETQSDGEEVVYYEDLRQVIEPLGLPIPDKSMMGFPTWR